jgi:hypothetical protein
VFVNCPFDADYNPLIKAMAFCVFDLGLVLRIASETHDSGTTRIGKIEDLISESRFGIHDLSRLAAAKKGDLARLNMPYELGLDMGCRRFGGSQYSDKRCLILSDKPYQYQAAISDIAGNDIMVHKNDASTLVEKVKNWLVDVATLANAPPPSRIWSRFNEFQTDNYKVLTSKGWSSGDIAKQPFREQTGQMADWIRKNPH